MHCQEGSTIKISGAVSWGAGVSTMGDKQQKLELSVKMDNINHEQKPCFSSEFPSQEMNHLGFFLFLVITFLPSMSPVSSAS